jgi:hypothetical protein
MFGRSRRDRPEQSFGRLAVTAGPPQRTPSLDLTAALTAAAARMGEIMTAHLSEVGAALARAAGLVGDGARGVRAERGDPTGDGPIGEPPP